MGARPFLNPLRILLELLRPKVSRTELSGGDSKEREGSILGGRLRILSEPSCSPPAKKPSGWRRAWLNVVVIMAGMCDWLTVSKADKEAQAKETAGYNQIQLKFMKPKPLRWSPDEQAVP